MQEEVVVHLCRCGKKFSTAGRLSRHHKQFPEHFESIFDRNRRASTKRPAEEPCDGESSRVGTAPQSPEPVASMHCDVIDGGMDHEPTVNATDTESHHHDSTGHKGPDYGSFKTWSNVFLGKIVRRLSAQDQDDLLKVLHHDNFNIKDVSFRSRHMLEVLIENDPKYFDFQFYEQTINLNQVSHTVYTRDAMQLAKFLWSDSFFKGNITYKPFKKVNAYGDRVVGGAHTGREWLDLQEAYPELTFIMLRVYQDSCNCVSSSSKSRKVYPVYLQCLNHPKHIRETAVGSQVLAYLPLLANELKGTKVERLAGSELWHRSMEAILKPVADAAPMTLMSADGQDHKVFTCVLYDISDFPEMAQAGWFAVDYV